MNSNKITIVDYLLMFATLVATLFMGLAAYALENMNEGLYAEIPREMIASGNYIVPHLNYVPYLEKPPMMYWLIALSYHIFGMSDFSARLVPALAGAVACLSLFYFAKKIQLGRVGWMAAIILSTSAGFIIISRVIIFDMTLTAFFTLSLLFFYLWYAEEKRRYLWVSFALLGGAYLTKGILSVALIPCIAIIFMLLAKTPWKKFFRLFDWVGISIFLLTIVPWTIAASIRQSGFAWDFFVNEQIYRFLNKRIPDDYHHGPIWYYIIPTIIILLPWSMFLPGLLKKARLPETSQILLLKKFLWVWFLVPFIFFSLSLAKAQYYIILGIPALAFLVAIKCNEYAQINNGKVFLYVYYLLVGGGVIVFSALYLVMYSPFASHFQINWQLPRELLAPLVTVFISTIIIALLATLLFYTSPSPYLKFIMIGWLILPWIYFLVADKQLLSPQRSEKTLAHYILQHDARRPVYLYQDYENISSILYYLKKRVAIIDTVSMDLFYGSTTPAAKGWFVTAREFSKQAKVEPVYVVMQANKLAAFTLAVAPVTFCVAKKTDDTLVVSNEIKDCQP